MNIRVIDGKILHKGTIYNTGDIVKDVEEKTAHGLIEIGVAIPENELAAAEVDELTEEDVFDCFTAPIEQVKALAKDMGVTIKRNAKDEKIRLLVNEALKESVENEIDTGVAIPENEENGEMPNTDMPE